VTLPMFLNIACKINGITYKNKKVTLLFLFLHSYRSIGMANGARFIEYKDREIYLIDYSNIKSSDEFLKVIKETDAFRENAKKTGKRNVLMLVDITGSYVYGETLDALKRAARLSRELARKEAVVGATGSKKVLLTIVQLFAGTQLRPFDTLKEAKEWLIQE
jgi:hypothetical protein